MRRHSRGTQLSIVGWRDARLCERCDADLLARFAEVRRSSSMIPSLTVFRGRPSAPSTASKTSTAKATSSGPCIFGLTT